MLWMEKLFNKLKIFSGWNQPFWIKFVEVEVFRKKLFLKILQSLQENTFCLNFFFAKLFRLYTCEFIKNSNWQRCFLVNFTKSFEEPFLQNTFILLLLRLTVLNVITVFVKLFSNKRFPEVWTVLYDFSRLLRWKLQKLCVEDQD